MKIDILKIRRKLPESIKKPLRWIYHKFNIKLDEKILTDLMEYYSLSRKEILYLLRHGGQLSADLWRCTNPKTEEQIKEFYQQDPFYAFNIIFWHGTKEQRKSRSEIVKSARGKILDYGGGVGDVCIKLDKMGLDVDYADLPGRTYNFAKWLFQKYNCKITMIDLSKTEILKKYDTIFCIDVIEHITNPKKLLDDFVGYLNDGGQLIITNLKPIVSKDAPMHFELGFNPENYLKSLGMTRGREYFLWIKK